MLGEVQNIPRLHHAFPVLFLATLACCASSNTLDTASTPVTGDTGLGRQNAQLLVVDMILFEHDDYPQQIAQKPSNTSHQLLATPQEKSHKYMNKTSSPSLLYFGMVVVFHQNKGFAASGFGLTPWPPTCPPAPKQPFQHTFFPPVLPSHQTLWPISTCPFVFPTNFTAAGPFVPSPRPCSWPP